MENIASQLNLSTKQLWGVIAFIIILISIPFAFTLAKQSQVFKSRASEIKSPPKIATGSATLNESKEVPSSSPLSELQKLLQDSTQNPSSATSTSSATPTPNLAFGPILTVKINLEGRATGKQAAKIFIGIASGQPSSKPAYILSFSVDFPGSGVFSGLSLAGLNPGSTYTAFIKGPSQIDTASTFVMSPTETVLNSNLPVLLLSGDINEDNVINSTDYTVVKNLFGTTSASSGWNERADINKDGVVNSLDLGLVSKNTGKTGASGLWSSPIPTASPSAQITPPAIGGTSGGYEQGSNPPYGGYWLWVP